MTSSLAPAPNSNVKTKSRNHDVLARRIVESWDKRAQVKQSIPEDYSLINEKLDFPLAQLPFDANAWTQKYGQNAISTICSLAWLAFNNKVISIESNLLVPCCKVLMDEAFEHNDVVTVEMLAQAQTDEAFHVLMAHKAMCICKEHRSLTDVKFPKCRIIQEYEHFERSNAQPWQKRLNVIAATIVTEVLINGYLAPISRNYSIQEFNRYVTNMHLIDEAAHGSVFRIIAHKLLSKLDQDQYLFFVERMRKSIDYFSDIDIDIWTFIIAQSGIQPEPEIIKELHNHQPPSDYTELEKLLTEVPKGQHA